MEVSGRQRPARYAVVFRADGELPAAGALVVDEDRLVLEGRGRDGPTKLCIPYSELTGVRIGRSPEERLNGRPALLLERENQRSVQVEPFGVGFLHELAQLLTVLATGTDERDEQVAVVVPLKKGRLERARELVDRGPPFDPAALGLTGHEVYLAADAAIFVFAGPGARAMLERASRDPSLWRFGLAWRDCIGGRPHVAAAVEARRIHGQQPVYRWNARGEPV